MSPRRLWVAALASLSLLGAAPVAQAPASDGPVAVAAKSCRGRYVHAVIGGAHKCLARGQYCARAYARQYRRYGFTCTYYGGAYRLR